MTKQQICKQALVYCLVIPFLTACGGATVSGNGSEITVDENVVDSENITAGASPVPISQNPDTQNPATENPGTEIPVDSSNNNPEPTLQVVESGGCDSFGPNCATYTLFTNGQFEVERNRDNNSVGGVSTGQSVQTGNTESGGQLDSGLLDSWLMQLALEDFSTLRLRLGAGSCMSCVDGVDFNYTIFQEINDIEQNQVFTSLFFDLNSSEPTIGMMVGLYQAMVAIGQPEIVSR